MSVNPHPTKAGYQQIRYYPNGRKCGQSVIVFKGSREEALAFEAELRTESKPADLHIFPKVNEVLPNYIVNYRLTHFDNKAITYLDRWRQYIGNVQFPNITEAIIERYKHDRIKDGVSPSTINKELSAL